MSLKSIIRQIFITQVSSGVVSFLASSTIVTFVVLKGFSTPYRRIIFGLSISDICQSLGLVFGPFLIESDIKIPQAIWASGNTRTCQLSGFLTVIGMNAVPMYTLFLCIYYVCKCKNKMTDSQFAHRVERKTHIFIIVFNLGLYFIALAMGTINPGALGNLCLPAAAPAGCRLDPAIFGECDPFIATAAHVFNVISTAIVPLASLVGIVACMAMLFWNVLMVERISFGAPAVAGDGTNHNGNGGVQTRRNRFLRVWKGTGAVSGSGSGTGAGAGAVSGRQEENADEPRFSDAAQEPAEEPEVSPQVLEQGQDSDSDSDSSSSVVPPQGLEQGKVQGQESASLFVPPEAPRQGLEQGQDSDNSSTFGPGDSHLSEAKHDTIQGIPPEGSHSNSHSSAGGRNSINSNSYSNISPAMHTTTTEAARQLESVSRLYKRELVTQALCYVVVFCLSSVPFLASNLIVLSGKRAPVSLLRVTVLFYPLAGFFNIIIYTRLNVASFRKKHPECSWLRAFWWVLKAGGEIPNDDNWSERSDWWNLTSFRFGDSRSVDFNLGPNMNVSSSVAPPDSNNYNNLRNHNHKRKKNCRGDRDRDGDRRGSRSLDDIEEDRPVRGDSFSK